MTSVAYDIEFDLDRFLKDLEGMRARRTRSGTEARNQDGYGRSDSLTDADDE
jgi:hypothetical protein